MNPHPFSAVLPSDSVVDLTVTCLGITMETDMRRIKKIGEGERTCNDNIGRPKRKLTWTI